MSCAPTRSEVSISEREGLAPAKPSGQAIQRRVEVRYAVDDPMSLQRHVANLSYLQVISVSKAGNLAVSRPPRLATD